MKAKTIRYRVTVDVERDTPALLDMLRYDWAHVVTWEHEHRFRPDTEEPTACGVCGMTEARHLRGDRYVVTLEGERFTPERWRSFSLRPEVIES